MKPESVKIYNKLPPVTVWESMMEGHEMMKKKSTTTTTQNPKRDPYDYYPESNFLGSSSSRHETVLNFNRPNKDFTTNPTKQIPNSVAPTKFSYGPMIVRVHPDGRPVQEDKIIPMDDDVHHYMMMKTKIPSLTQFEPRNKPSYPHPYAFYIRPTTRRQ